MAKSQRKVWGRDFRRRLSSENVGKQRARTKHSVIVMIYCASAAVSLLKWLISTSWIFFARVFENIMASADASTPQPVNGVSYSEAAAKNGPSDHTTTLDLTNGETTNSAQTNAYRPPQLPTPGERADPFGWMGTERVGCYLVS